MASVKRRLDTESDIQVLHNELDKVSCPICMEYPHNAVLLRCSSHVKGCLSYICDTSYRHSNCLDRFKKQRDHSGSNMSLPIPLNSSTSSSVSDTSLTLSVHMHGAIENNVELPEGALERSSQVPNLQQEPQGEAVLDTDDSESFHDRIEFEEANVNSLELGFSLTCPLCRGDVLGWDVVEEARKYLNSKKRSCSRESCSFSGNYQELRRHARRVHPTTRPCDVDPSRERAWRCLERQREYGDIISAVRSAMPGSIVVGDYVIENGDRFTVEREADSGEAQSPWLTTLFLFQMIGSADGSSEPRARSRPWTRNRRSTGALPERRFLWGENLLGLQDDDDEEDDNINLHVFSDAGEGEDASPVSRRRRRLNWSRSDDQS